MKILVAPDAYKGSLTANDVATTMAKAIKNVDAAIQVQQIPLSDGGEGFLTCFESLPDYKKYVLRVHNALNQEIDAPYIVLADGTVIIEYAEIAGLMQVDEKNMNPDVTTSYGLGEMLNHCLEQNYKKVVIGIGGSATNDAGYGMLCALGMSAYDKSGNLLDYMSESLLKIDAVQIGHALDKLKAFELIIASDVSNPLVGEQGASYVFGPQKGARQDQVKAYHQAHLKLSQLLVQAGYKDFAKSEGAGAAGGLGFALMHLGGKYLSGAAYCADLLNLEVHVKTADLVITGEGKSDLQTLKGKAPHYLAQVAAKHHKPVLLISGAVEDLTRLNEAFSGCFSIVNRPMPLEESVSGAVELLYNQTTNLIHFVKQFK